MHTIWVDEVTDLELDGEMAVVTLVADGEALVLRGKRSTTVKGLALCARRYQEHERAERGARVLPFRSREHG